MKKTTLFYTALLTVAGFSANAQINQTPVHTGGGQIMTSTQKQSAADGSMYMDENYLPAKVTGTELTQLLRYNAYVDNFEISNPQEQKVYTLPKQAGVIINFVGSGDEYTMVDYISKDDDEINGYLKIISNEPKVKIYKRERIYLQAGKSSSDTYQRSRPAKYVQARDEFYIKTGDGKAQYFRKSKDLAKLIPSKSDEIQNYIKKNDIDVDKASDLEKLGTYINSIL